MLKKIKNNPASIPILILLIFSVLVFTGAYFFILNTTTDVNEQNRRYLQETAVQNAELVKSTVNYELETLQAIANIVGSEPEFSLDRAMDILALESKRSSFKRLGFVPADGVAITTDNSNFDILDRDYYKRALAGESNVSDRLIDKVDGGYINVYAVPMYRGEDIVAVIIATSSTDIFSELLNVTTFSGEGFSYVIKHDGTPVVYTQNKNALVEFTNLFDEMRANGQTEAAVTNIIDAMHAGETGLIEYTRDGVPRVGAYSRIGVNDWFVVSVVPKHIIFESTERLVRRNIFGAVCVILLFVLLALFIIFQDQKSGSDLRQLAYVDTLTGGNNLNKFTQLAEDMLTQKKDDPLYMMRIDIDNFRLINDMYGFAEGDRVLRTMDRLIRKLIGDSGICGRIGSDDFILLIHCTDDDGVINLGTKFRDEFRDYCIRNGNGYTLNFTTGVYKVPPDETDIVQIMERATMAHRSAKQLNFDPKFIFYDNALRNEAIRVKTIEDSMRAALRDGEFVVYLQPKNDIATGLVTGAEALIRWIRCGMVVPPGEFISIFEKNGFIAEIDMFVMEEVCRIQRKWLDLGITPVPISVNQSKPLVYGNGYFERICAVTEKYNVPPSLVELELLETIIHENVEWLMDITKKLQEFGFLICIDDFGSGYSSLSLLKDLTADVLKIDRGFLTNAEDNKRGEFVLSNIIALAKGLQMSVVTEGVETDRQAGMLVSLGCYTAQGYYYAKPMTLSDFEKKYYIKG